MAIEYVKAPDEVLDLAEDIIEKHHSMLKMYRIGFVMWYGDRKTGDRWILGKASKVAHGKLSPYMTEHIDGLIEPSYYWWNANGGMKRRALIDHELCHFAVDLENDVLKIVGHDLEEFNQIIERYGFWKDDVTRTAKVIQHRFDLGDTVPVGGVFSVGPIDEAIEKMRPKKGSGVESVTMSVIQDGVETASATLEAA